VEQSTIHNKQQGINQKKHKKKPQITELGNSQSEKINSI